MIELEEKRKSDILVQGGVAIAAGAIFLATLLFPWLSIQHSAISGLMLAKSQTAVVIPMTLILLSVLTIFGGAIHIAGYEVGIKLATFTSALVFFVAIMVIIYTLAIANDLEGKTLDLLIGPWIAAAGAILGAISPKLERK